MTTIYLLKAITNMHVGSGDVNIDIIDNKVQKDATTQLPIIYSSSLKGALREHFENKWDRNDKKIDYIFGKEGSSGGRYSFFEANILTLPQRSNVKPYFNVTSPSIIEQLIKTLTIFNNEDSFTPLIHSLKNFYEVIKDTKEAVIFEEFENNNIYLEDIKASYKKVEELPPIFNKNLAVLSDMNFMQIELPVIARNSLDENGKSKTLWYEEIVPKESTFFFSLIKDKDFIKEFDEILENEIIQIGANRSIGYGFCTLKNILRIKDE